IAQSQALAMQGAILAGAFARMGGAGRAEIEAAERIGATLNERRYSKGFELEADELGTRIAYTAGFDPVRGAAFFGQVPDPGDEFLGTHPPTAARLAIVRRAVRAMQAGG